MRYSRKKGLNILIGLVVFRLISYILFLLYDLRLDPVFGFILNIMLLVVFIVIAKQYKAKPFLKIPILIILAVSLCFNLLIIAFSGDVVERSLNKKVVHRLYGMHHYEYAHYKRVYIFFWKPVGTDGPFDNSGNDPYDDPYF